MEKVSAIIPTYNRFKYLLNCVKSIQNQTYKNIEIIIVNDCSTQKEYYEFNWNENIKIIHLQENTKKKFGYACAGYVRNKGIEQSTGKYIAFCDDDDIWFPEKIELQLKAMKKSNLKMCCSEGLIGKGIYNSKTNYQKHLSEKYYKVLKKAYIKKGNNFISNGIPNIFDYKNLKHINLIICSSVIISKDILHKINNFKNIKPPGEDFDCWKRALKYTNCYFINKPCMYYDEGHGDGQNY